MNVAAGYRDGSHWKKTENGCQSDNDVYEWFRDESKCLSKFGSDKNKIEATTKRPENVGIPGFTPAERERFQSFLSDGKFCDVWRNLHPEGVLASGKEDGRDDEKSLWELPNYTWRGTVAKNFGGYAKYQGKGQRIDYFLLSPSIGVKEIEKCEIRGYGTNRDGLFCGSDHCAVELRFKDHG